MVQTSELLKLYEAYEQESMGKAGGEAIAPVVRQVVNDLFENSDRDEFLLAAVHKLVKQVMQNDEIQYSTVASAVKADHSGYVLVKDDKNRVFIRRAPEREEEE